MTIKELADALGVSKTAIRKYMTEDFRCAHAETNRNGAITIDSDGCKLIAETMGKKWEQSETTANQIPETSGNTENLTIPRSVWEYMEGQVKHLEEELAKERAHNREMADKFAKLADQAQRLHAGDMQQQLTEAVTTHGEDETAVAIEKAPAVQERWSLWAWLGFK